MSDKPEFFIYTHETEKHLTITRPNSIRSDAYSPCCMSPDDVDYEMSQGKHSEILEICGMNQQSLEYFVSHYGKTYRYLSFFKCQLIQDFSPLADLEKLEAVSIYWNIRTDRLWDMSKNKALKTIAVDDAKRLTYRLPLLNTSPTLEEVCIYGSIFNNTPMASLDCFSDMPSLKVLRLRRVRPENKCMDFLNTLQALECFDFPAGMLTTEEIAYLVAKYPHLSGQSLCAYNKEDAMLNDVRVCGFRKPGLDLPQQQKRLDKYVAEFDALVAKYRAELGR